MDIVTAFLSVVHAVGDFFFAAFYILDVLVTSIFGFFISLFSYLVALVSGFVSNFSVSAIVTAGSDLVSSSPWNALTSVYNIINAIPYLGTVLSAVMAMLTFTLFMFVFRRIIGGVRSSNPHIFFGSTHTEIR